MASELAVLRAALRSNPEHHEKLKELAERGSLGPLTDVPDDVPLTVVAAPEHFGIDGAKQARCGCGIIVWLSPSTQRMIIARGAVPNAIRVLCAWCFIDEMKDNEKPTQ
jgi:hypothetical protein